MSPQVSWSVVSGKDAKLEFLWWTDETKTVLRDIGEGLLCITLTMLAASLSAPSAHGQGAQEYQVRYIVILPQGSSMRPTINSENTVILCEVAPFSDLRRGDIVVYRSINCSSGNVVHRLTKRTTSGAWKAKGDNNLFHDKEHVTQANYIARVCALFFF